MSIRLSELIKEERIESLLVSDEIKSIYFQLKESDLSKYNQLDVALALGIGAIANQETSVLKLSVKKLLTLVDDPDFKERNIYQNFINLYLDKTAKDIKRSVLSNSIFFVILHILIYITFRKSIQPYQIGFLFLVLFVLLVLNIQYVLRKKSLRNLNHSQISSLLKHWKDLGS